MRDSPSDGRRHEQVNIRGTDHACDITNVDHRPVPFHLLFVFKALFPRQSWLERFQQLQPDSFLSSK